MKEADDISARIFFFKIINGKARENVCNLFNVNK